MEKRLDSQMILSQADMGHIRFAHERQVAKFLLEVNPELSIIYEPAVWGIEDTTISGGMRVVTPDFEVRNPENDSQFILEVTRRKNQRVKDRQRAIMRAANPDYPFIVFSALEVNAIQARGRHRGIKLFDRCPSNSFRQVRELIVSKDRR